MKGSEEIWSGSMRHTHCVYMLRTAGGSIINLTPFRDLNASPSIISMVLHVKSQASEAKDAFTVSWSQILFRHLRYTYKCLDVILIILNLLYILLLLIAKLKQKIYICVGIQKWLIRALAGCTSFLTQCPWSNSRMQTNWVWDEICTTWGV